MCMKSWTWSKTLGSPVKLRPSGQSELSKVGRVRFQRSCRLFIIRLSVARSPVKSSSGAAREFNSTRSPSIERRKVPARR